MPKAVAILEGDSTSLVKSIDDAKGAMQKMDKEARKLSDQIRDVADEADKAAGALVNKIGGQTAVKAIAGIGGAFLGAQQALGAFSGSMAAFAATQGEAGAKAMADLDFALNELQGQLFTAVMGTDDMEAAVDTLIDGINILKTAFDLLLVPVTAFSALVRDLATDHSSAATQARDHAKAEKEYADALANANGLMTTAHAGYANVERSIIGLLGTKKEMAIFDLEQTQRDYQAIILQQDRAMQARRLAAGDFAAAEAESKKRAELVDAEAAKIKATDDKVQKMGKEGTRGRTDDQIRAMAEARVERSKDAQLQLDQARQSARQESDARLSIQELGFKEERERLKAAQARIEEDKKKLLAAPETQPRVIPVTVAVTTTNTGTPAEEHEDPYVLRQRSMDKFMEKERLAEEERIANLAKTNKERIAMFGSANDEQIQLYYEAQIEKNIADQAEFDAARARAIELHDLTFDLTQSASEFVAAKRAEEKAAHDEKVANIKAGLQEYGKAAAQQLATGKKASAVAADLARKAIGDAISAKGDEAMAQAAIYAAAFNPQAIPMAAAGVAAYAAAAMLGSSSKKSASSTPASVAPVQAAPVNTSFNLRVDAAFADGESIARQFAMMQRNAQARGLVPVGA